MKKSFLSFFSASILFLSLFLPTPAMGMIKRIREVYDGVSLRGAGGAIRRGIDFTADRTGLSPEVIIGATATLIGGGATLLASRIISKRNSNVYEQTISTLQNEKTEKLDKKEREVVDSFAQDLGLSSGASMSDCREAIHGLKDAGRNEATQELIDVISVPDSNASAESENEAQKIEGKWNFFSKKLKDLYVKKEDHENLLSKHGDLVSHFNLIKTKYNSILKEISDFTKLKPSNETFNVKEALEAKENGLVLLIEEQNEKLNSLTNILKKETRGTDKNVNIVDQLKVFIKNSRMLRSPSRAFCTLSPVLEELVETFKEIELEVQNSSETVTIASVIKSVFECQAKRLNARVSISEDGKITRRSSSHRHRNSDQKSCIRIKKSDPNQSENQSAGDDSSQD